MNRAKRAWDWALSCSVTNHHENAEKEEFRPGRRTLDRIPPPNNVVQAGVFEVFAVKPRVGHPVEGAGVVAVNPAYHRCASGANEQCCSESRPEHPGHTSTTRRDASRKGFDEHCRGVTLPERKRNICAGRGAGEKIEDWESSQSPRNSTRMVSLAIPAGRNVAAQRVGMTVPETPMAARDDTSSGMDGEASTQSPGPLDGVGLQHFFPLDDAGAPSATKDTSREYSQRDSEMAAKRLKLGNRDNEQTHQELKHRTGHSSEAKQGRGIETLSTECRQGITSTQRCDATTVRSFASARWALHEPLSVARRLEVSERRQDPLAALYVSSLGANASDKSNSCSGQTAGTLRTQNDEGTESDKALPSCIVLGSALPPSTQQNAAPVDILSPQASFREDGLSCAITQSPSTCASPRHLPSLADFDKAVPPIAGDVVRNPIIEEGSTGESLEHDIIDESASEQHQEDFVACTQMQSAENQIVEHHKRPPPSPQPASKTLFVPATANINSQAPTFSTSQPLSGTQFVPVTDNETEELKPPRSSMPNAFVPETGIADTLDRASPSPRPTSRPLCIPETQNVFSQSQAWSQQKTRPQFVPATGSLDTSTQVLISPQGAKATRTVSEIQNFTSQAEGSSSPQTSRTLFIPETPSSHLDTPVQINESAFRPSWAPYASNQSFRQEDINALLRQPVLGDWRTPTPESDVRVLGSTASPGAVAGTLALGADESPGKASSEPDFAPERAQCYGGQSSDMLLPGPDSANNSWTSPSVNRPPVTAAELNLQPAKATPTEQINSTRWVSRRLSMVTPIPFRIDEKGAETSSAPKKLPHSKSALPKERQVGFTVQLPKEIDNRNKEFSDGPEEETIVRRDFQGEQQEAIAVASCIRKTVSMFSSGKGVPVPFNPKSMFPPQDPAAQERLKASSPGESSVTKTPNKQLSLFATGAGHPIAKSEGCGGQMISRTCAADGSDVPAPDSSAIKVLFTTGKGTPLAPIDPKKKLAQFSTGSDTPLESIKGIEMHSVFTTGKGTPLQPVVGRGKALPPVTPTAVPCLFTTGKGQPLPAASPGTAFPVFSTAKGSPVPLVTPRHLKMHHAEQGLGRPLLDRGKSLFGTRNGNTVGSGCASHRTPLGNLTTNETRTIEQQFKSSRYGILHVKKPHGGAPGPFVQRGSSLKSKEFKAPRRIPPTRARTGGTRAAVTIPDVPFPLLSTTGDLVFLSRGAKGKITRKALMSNHRSILSAVEFESACTQFPLPFPSTCLSGPVQLHACLEFRFAPCLFGCLEDLPEAVRAPIKRILEPKKRGTELCFGANECGAWVTSMFPCVEERPATCIGSPAWTRMAYSLAVWKYARLSVSIGLQSGSGGGSSMKSCFTAAHIIRDIYRRIYVEWKQNRASPLVRMVRKDAAPQSHVVLAVASIGGPRGQEKSLQLEVTDGWYIARAVTDSVLADLISVCQRLRVGDKIHVSHASVASTPSRPFFFGEGDELGTTQLCLSANGTRRVRPQVSMTAKMGFYRQSPLFLTSLACIYAAGGAVPCLVVTVERSYPVRYMETVTSSAPEAEDESKQLCLNNGCSEDSDVDEQVSRVWRRQEGEDIAAEKHAEQLRQWAEAAAVNGCGFRNERNDARRDVISMVEFTVAGAGDAGKQKPLFASVSIWRPNELVLNLVRQEGVGLVLHGARPSQRGSQMALTVDANSVFPASNNKTCGRGEAGKGKANELPIRARNLSSAQDLVSGRVRIGEDFDGVFFIVHVGPLLDCGSSRHLFMIDTLSEMHVIALRLSEEDARNVPRALHGHGRGPRRGGVDTDNSAIAEKGWVVGMTDVTLHGTGSTTGLLDVSATLRSDFVSHRTLRRLAGARKQGKGMLYSEMAQMAEQLEGRMRTDSARAQIGLVQEAVQAVIAGERDSVTKQLLCVQEETAPGCP